MCKPTRIPETLTASPVALVLLSVQKQHLHFKPSLDPNTHPGRPHTSFHSKHLKSVVCTSSPLRPPAPGLCQVPSWTLHLGHCLLSQLGFQNAFPLASAIFSPALSPTSHAAPTVTDFSEGQDPADPPFLTSSSSVTTSAAGP